MADLETLFRALQQVGARYVVVGGVAAVLHGHARLTSAVELVVDFEPSKAEQVTAILESLGFQPKERFCAGERFYPEMFADPEFRARWLRDGKGPVFSMWDSNDPKWTVDLVVDPPIDFASLLSRSQLMELRTTSVPVAATPDLVRLAELTGREGDSGDVEKLREIQRRRDGNR